MPEFIQRKYFYYLREMVLFKGLHRFVKDRNIDVCLVIYTSNEIRMDKVCL